MYIKIVQPNKDGSKIYHNTGSVNQIIAYLRHETNKKEEDINVFFNHDKEDISDIEVKEKIDSNSQRIDTDKEKFYSIIISPAEEELVHINNNNATLKKYVRQVMENYAANFQLKNGKQLTSKDLIWFAAIHSDRDIKPIDLQSQRFLSLKEAKRVKELDRSSHPSDRLEASKILEKAKERELNRYNPDHFSAGNKKPGFHKHIHIVVSRLDASQTFHLNPKTRKASFHIQGFQEKCARDFQQMFGYRQETLSKGFYQQHSQQDESYFNKKIEKTTEQINERLSYEKLDPARMQEIGKACSFSKAFFINLTKLKYRFNQGNYTHDPYFFVKNGKEQKLEDYYNKLSEGGAENKEERTKEHNVRQENAEYATDSKGKEFGTDQVIQLLGSIRGGQVAIKETLMLDEERKKLKRYQEKGRGGDNIEMS